MTVKQVADKLASFVAKNGRQFENITRQRNPGDTPFKYDATYFSDTLFYF
jgi:splicing factor 4